MNKAVQSSLYGLPDLNTLFTPGRNRCESKWEYAASPCAMHKHYYLVGEVYLPSTEKQTRKPRHHQTNGDGCDYRHCAN